MNKIFEKGLTDHRMFKLSESLYDLQKNVIGIFKLHASVCGPFSGSTLNCHEMVIQKTESTVRTIHIGNFLGIRESHYGIDAGEFTPLPKGFDNLYDLLQKPYSFHYWLTETYKK